MIKLKVRLPSPCFICCLLLALSAELFKMVCEANETDVDIRIPAVMLPQDAGVSLEENLLNNSSGKSYLAWLMNKKELNRCLS